MSDETAPDPGPEPLPDDDMVYRQVHPMHSRETAGGVSPEAFVPQRNDDNLLSTLHGRIGPDEAYRRWTEDLEHQSLGSFGVTVAEADTVEVEVPSVGTRGVTIYEDGHLINVDDHCSVDFNELPSMGQRKQAARKLLEFALERGGPLNSLAPDDSGPDGIV